MLWDEPRSTSSHCGSENAEDHLVPVLPSTAADAGKVAFSSDEAVAVLFSATFVVPQVAAAALGAVAPIPETRKDTNRTAKASRLTAARREPGARPARLRRVLRSGFGTFTLDLRIGITLKRVVGGERGPSRGKAAGPGDRGNSRGRVDLEFPEGVAVLGGAGGAVHADVAAGAGDVEGLVAAGAGGGGVDGCPVGVVGGYLDLEGGGVGGLPVEADLADALGRAEVDFEPLRVGERRGPSRSRVAVDRRRRGEARVLQSTRPSRSCSAPRWWCRRSRYRRLRRCFRCCRPGIPRGSSRTGWRGRCRTCGCSGRCR